MQALIIIDVQNEFSENGKRPVPNHANAVEVIKQRVEQARSQGVPIAWVRHFNKPTESPAFKPGTWGFEFTPGLAPDAGNALEMEFQKNVWGAFTGTDVGAWLKKNDADAVLIVGFYTHGCVSTTSREALMLDLNVSIDPNGTGACDLNHELLGRFSADEVRRSALLQLTSMGASVTALDSTLE